MAYKQGSAQEDTKQQKLYSAVLNYTRIWLSLGQLTMRTPQALINFGEGTLEQYPAV